MKAANILRLQRAALAAAFTLLMQGAMAQAPAKQLPELNADNIAALLNPLFAEWTDKHHGPGAVVVVVTRDKQVFAQGYGVADVAAKRPFTADATLVRPGSISKLFTAISVMQLVDAGKLDLDRDVNAYIDFSVPLPDGGVPVTLRRLLNHRAGFEEHMKGLFSKARDPEPLGRWLKKSLPQRIFPKGDVQAYSNYGFALAGYIVERAAGEPFEQYVQGHILDPLGMKHSTFSQPLPDDLAPLMANSYRSSDQPPFPFETITAPPGGLAATGEDMGRFMRALLGGGELDGVRILSKTRLDEMMAPANATPAGYVGLAFFGGRLMGHRTIGHDGGTMFFASELALFPEQGLGIFVSRDGSGKTLEDIGKIPLPVNAIVRRFLPSVANTAGPGESAADDGIAGGYQTSRRADSTILRLMELLTQRVIRKDSAGNLRVAAAIYPFNDGTAFRRVSPRLYVGPGNSRLAFVSDGDGGAHFEPGRRNPATRPLVAQHPLDRTRARRQSGRRRGVAAGVARCGTLAAFPQQEALERSDRRPPPAFRGEAGAADRCHRYHRQCRAPFMGQRRLHHSGRCARSVSDWPVRTRLGRRGRRGARRLGGHLVLARQTGSRWSRVHHTLLAASCLMMAWFFVVFRIAGTTLNF